MIKNVGHKLSAATMKDKAYFWFALVVAVPIIFACLNSQPWRNRGCFLNENVVIDEEFSGTVLEKYRNTNWGYRNAQYLQMSSGKSVKLIRDYYYSEIEVGDSINKVKESLILTVVKPCTIKLLPYMYSCDE